MNLYELDPNTRDILRLGRFLEELSATDLIDAVSAQHDILLGDGSDLSRLDPKPFIRTFEAVLSELKQLRAQNDARLIAVENALAEGEARHAAQTSRLHDQVRAAGSRFDDLEQAVSGVGAVITPLGERLQEATTLKDRSLELIFIAKCYNEFLQNNSLKLLKELQNLRKASDRRNCGRYIAKLTSLAKKLAADNGDEKLRKVYQAVLDFSASFEDRLLKEFHDTQKTKECYDILSDFNGADKAQEAYLQKIDFISKTLPQEDALAQESFLSEEHPFWRRIADPLEHYNHSALISLAPEWPELLDVAHDSIIGQFNSMRNIFTRTQATFLKVFDAFLRRAFRKIGSEINSLLSFAQALNTLAYVRLLHLTFLLVTAFVEDIKAFVQENYTKVYLEDVLTHKPDTEKTLGTEICAALDHQLSELFYQLLTEKNYVDREKKSLEDIYSKINASFEKKHPKIFKDRALALRLATTDSVKESSLLSPLGLPTLTLPLLGTRSASGSTISHNILEKNKLIQLRTYMKLKLERTSSNASKFSLLNDLLLLLPRVDQVSSIFLEVRDSEVENLDQIEENEIKLSKIDFMVQNAVEALSRLSDLKPLMISEYSLEVLRILIFGVGTYLEYGLEMAYYKLIHMDYKKNDSLSFNHLKIIGKANRVLKLVTDFIRLIVLPLAINNAIVKKKIINLTNGYLTTCELSLNIILRDSVELVLSKVQLYLDRQKKKDYNVSKKLANLSLEDDAEIDLNSEDTETCQNITKFLSGLQQDLLDNKLLLYANYTNFLIEVGVNLLGLLVSHFRKFQINEIGGVILTKDIISYQAMIDSWKIEELSERFVILRELANLFTVQPNYINSLVKEGQLANLNPDIIQQYVGKRVDYTLSFLNKWGLFI